MNTIQASAPTTQHTIEADWQLNSICNMKCGYCFSTTNPTIARSTVIDPARCLEFFDATGEVWSLHMTGGEPFLTSGFVKLCSVLSSRHFLSLNSNLCSALVRDFAEAVDRSHVQYVHCCLHLEERGRLNLWKALEDNLRALTRRGFLVFASQVMTSKTFAVFPQAAERLADLGVVLIPKFLQGLFEGKWYPHAYSEKEKAVFCTLSEEAEAGLRSLTPLLMQQRVTVNPLRDREFLSGFPIFRGVGCSAGARFFTIQSNGNIYRCGSNHLLGNIEKDIFGPLPPYTPCDSSYYPYFCLRYSELAQSPSGATLIPLEVPPSTGLQTIYGLVRIGRKVLKQVIS
jgi:MoaA/NifB/PqqE/SkfB family radical SAM enzyme